MGKHFNVTPAAAHPATNGRTATVILLADDRLSIAARSGRKSPCISTPDRYLVASDDRSP